MSPCFYGIDMPTKKELVASDLPVEQICEYLEVDSLGYLSIDGMLKCVPPPSINFCKACFDGKYPIVPRDALADKC
jgi:amidophosphoribosyltransferase